MSNLTDPSSPEKSDQILGYISNVSPVKTSNKRKYFNFNIHTKHDTRRGVCFSPEKRQLMTSFQSNNSPVKIENFRVNTEASNDLVLDQKTNITAIEFKEEDKFIPVIVSSDTLTTLDSLKSATADQFITIKAKVHSLSAVKKIVTKMNKTLNKQEGMLLDPTGQIKVILWENQVNSLTEGKTYIFNNIRMKENNFGDRYVNPPKDGTLYSYTLVEGYDEESLPELDEVPDTTIQAQGFVSGISPITRKKCCRAYFSKVTPKDDIKGSCQKCRMTVSLKACFIEWYLQIMFITSSGLSLRLSVFNNEAKMLLAICNLENTCEDGVFENALMAFSNLSIQYDTVTRKLVDIKVTNDC